jgi:hypothetical protein
MGSFKNKNIRLIKEGALIICGVISATFGLKSFLMPSHFIDGGVTGISLLVSTLTNLELAYLIVIINWSGFRDKNEYCYRSTLIMLNFFAVFTHHSR